MEGAKLLKCSEFGDAIIKEYVITTCVKYCNGRITRPLFYLCGYY